MKDTLNHCSTKQKELFSGVHSHTQKRFPFKKQSVNIKTGSVTRQYPGLNINTVFVDFPGSVTRQYLVLNINTVIVDSAGSVMRQYLVLNINTAIVDSAGRVMR